MDSFAPNTPPAENPADVADALLADAVAIERARTGRAGGGSADLSPEVRETLACVAAAVAIVALAYASWASGAYIPLLWGVDLGIHEFGHLVTYWAPWQVCAAAGSAFQVFVPLGAAGYALFARKSWPGAGFLAAWAGCSARNVAVYIADAPYQRLPLFGGDGVTHDWAQLLQGRPMLYAGAIANGVVVLGWLLIATGLVLALAPLARRAIAGAGARAHEREFEARRAALPVREPHGPIG